MGRAAAVTSWDEELTELDLDLDGALIELTPQVVSVQDVPVVKRAPPTPEEDDDLPMLDPREFVTMAPKAVPPKREGWAWLSVLLPWVAVLLAACVFRVEIVRFLGLI